MKLQERCKARYQLTVDEYEAVEKERTSYIDKATYEPPLGGLGGHYAQHYAGEGLLVLRGLDGFFRKYDWS